MLNYAYTGHLGLILHHFGLRLNLWLEVKDHEDNMLFGKISYSCGLSDSCENASAELGISVAIQRYDSNTYLKDSVFTPY